MKYIIDLPDAYTSKSALFGDILSIPICLEGGKRYGIPTGIKLEPYTEPDEYEIMQKVEDEVWEFAWKIIDMDLSVYQKMFGGKGCPADYREAKTKYNEWLRKNHDGCKGCKYDYKSSGEEPCFSCKQNYLDKWEATE